MDANQDGSIDFHEFMAMMRGAKVRRRFGLLALGVCDSDRSHFAIPPFVLGSWHGRVSGAEHRTPRLSAEHDSAKNIDPSMVGIHADGQRSKHPTRGLRPPSRDMVF